MQISLDTAPAVAYTLTMKSNAITQEEEQMAHYIGMAGLHGCLPQTCDVYESQSAAAESLAQIHDLGKKRAAALRRDGYLELNLHRDGNEYAEITECDCATPETHSDSE